MEELFCSHTTLKLKQAYLESANSLFKVLHTKDCGIVQNSHYAYEEMQVTISIQCLVHSGHPFHFHSALVLWSLSSGETGDGNTRGKTFQPVTDLYCAQFSVAKRKCNILTLKFSHTLEGQRERYWSSGCYVFSDVHTVPRDSNMLCNRSVDI